MKRVFAILLSVVMLVSLLSACGSKASIQKEWSKLLLAEHLPTPQKGKLYSGSNLDDIFMGAIEKVDEDYYLEYKTACVEMGYTIDSQETGSSYSAFNTDAYKVSLAFHSKRISITLEAPEELSKLIWPTTNIGSKLPVPKAEQGKVLYDTNGTFKVIVGDTTRDVFNAYVSTCEEKGFIVDYIKQDDEYSAKDADGYRLDVRYVGCNRMEIMIQIPKAETPAIDNSATQDNNASSDKVGIGTEFKAAMDSYENFMNEYVAFMKQYKANPTDTSLLSAYTDYMSRYTTFVNDFAKWEGQTMNAAETAYYLEVQNRVAQKLLEVA